ncbi:MAG: hypothetical protein IID48_12995 [Proteobacteria bacterium]|nr:hypothetical protein [Pseudomonadota bacterium]
MEAKMLEGDDEYDALAHGRMIGTLNRTLDLLDPEVRNKRVTDVRDYPGSLEDYLASPECRETVRKNREKHRSTK